MNKTKKIIWIVDDDKDLLNMIKEYLSKTGYIVRGIELGNQVIPLLNIKNPDLIILDLMLPDIDGLSILRKIKEKDQNIAVLMLTSKADGIDRIIGLEQGADDYLGKPFLPRELSARIEAILRRSKGTIKGLPIPQKKAFNFGDMEIDFQKRILNKEDQIIKLSTGEFSLLNAFIDHPNRPLSRRKLLELSEGCDQLSDERSIDVQVSRLRKVIENNPSQPIYIQTIWGYGYVFNSNDK